MPSDLEQTRLKLNNNLRILQEREAKYAGNAPVELLNQIDDHRQAILLTEQAIAGEISETEWREAGKPLLAFSGEHVVNIEAETYIAGDQHLHQAPQEPPFWQRLSRANLVLAIVLGIIATAAAVLAIPQFNAWVFPPPPEPPTPTVTVTPVPTRTPTITPTPSPAPTPLAFEPAVGDETLIVLATFHETGANKSEPHVKIRRAIEEAAAQIKLKNMRVELEPTELTADQQSQATALGEQYQASIVIWGEDTGVQVLVNFLNLKQPFLPLSNVIIDETERTQLAAPSTYNDFIITDLPGQLTFLSFFALGQSFYLNQQYDRSQEMVQQAIASLPPETTVDGLNEAYFLLAWLHSVPLRNPEAALPFYNQAIDLDPNNFKLYFNRGLTFKRLGDVSEDYEDFYRQALDDYSQAIILNPDATSPYFNRGTLYLNSGNYEAALADYNKVIELEQDDPAAYYNRATAYYYNGDSEQAVVDYSQALAIRPDYPQALINRGIAFLDLKKNIDALADFEHAIALDPARPRAYYYRGQAYERQGDLPAAIESFQQGLAVDTNPRTRQLAQDDLVRLQAAQATPEKPTPEDDQ